MLPFDNLNNDPKEDYFSEGITKDIVNDLSKFQNLLVIDSGSVSGDERESASVEEISRRLGVRYVLEGSVLKRGERVRINAQLVDSATGQHLWAERFDEATKNIWDIQDEITGRIVRTLALRITEIEQRRVLAKSTDNLKAYEFTLRGRALLARQSRMPYSTRSGTPFFSHSKNFGPGRRCSRRSAFTRTPTARNDATIAATSGLITAACSSPL